LFGADTRPARIRSADLIVSISETSDDDLSADQGNQPSAGQTPIGGRYAGTDLAGSFGHAGRRVSMAASGTGTIRRYPTLDSFVGSTYSGGADLTATLDRRMTLHVSGSASYASTFAFDTFTHQTAINQEAPSTTGLVEGASVANTPVDATRTSKGGGFELTRALTRHISLSAVAGLWYSERGVIGERDDERHLGVQLRQALGPDTVLQAAYAVRAGTQGLNGTTTRIVSHDIQVTLENQWRHSAISRTVFSLSGGPAVMTQRAPAVVLAPPAIDDSGGVESPAVAPAAVVDDRLLKFVGAAVLTHQVNRVWSAQVSYRRGAGLRDGVVFSNTAALGARAALGRRVGVTATAGFTDGEIGVTAADSRDQTAFGTVRLQVALSRLVAVYGQGFLYRYDFGNGQPLPEGYPRQLDRRGVRAGIALWMPLQRE
jgi:hypothetical protein